MNREKATMLRSAKPITRKAMPSAVAADGSLPV